MHIHKPSLSAPSRGSTAHLPGGAPVLHDSLFLLACRPSLTLSAKILFGQSVPNNFFFGSSRSFLLFRAHRCIINTPYVRRWVRPQILLCKILFELSLRCYETSARRTWLGYGISLSGPQTSRTPAAPALAPPRPGERGVTAWDGNRTSILHSIVQERREK